MVLLKFCDFIQQLLQPLPLISHIIILYDSFNNHLPLTSKYLFRPLQYSQPNCIIPQASEHPPGQLLLALKGNYH